MHSGNVVTAWVLHAYDALLEQTGAADLGLRELTALTLVSTHTGQSIEWLRARVGLTQSGTVRLVDRLEQAGLVRRAAPSGRQVTLSVTAHGRRQLRRWYAARDAVVAELLRELSEDQRDRLVELLAVTLERSPRPRVAADATCRACEWPVCVPECPVDRSVPVDAGS